jgi:hypothetical protein
MTMAEGDGDGGLLERRRPCSMESSHTTSRDDYDDDRSDNNRSSYCPIPPGGSRPINHDAEILPSAYYRIGPLMGASKHPEEILLKKDY